MNSSTSFICLLGSVKVRFLSALFVDVVVVKKISQFNIFLKKSLIFVGGTNKQNQINIVKLFGVL